MLEYNGRDQTTYAVCDGKCGARLDIGYIGEGEVMNKAGWLYIKILPLPRTFCPTCRQILKGEFEDEIRIEIYKQYIPQMKRILEIYEKEEE